MLAIWLEYNSSSVRLPSPAKTPDSMLAIWLEYSFRCLQIAQPREDA